MKKISTADRLKYIMSERNLKQVDILTLSIPFCKKYNVKMNKSDISQYVAGKVEPSQEKLVVLGMALNVTESWLMGFDVPMNRQDISSEINYSNKNNINEYDPLILSDIEKKIIIEYRKADNVSREMVHRVLGIKDKINETKMA